MLDTVTVSVAIDRPWQSLYAAFWHPEAFPQWASGLSRSRLLKKDGRWLAEGPEGKVFIRFTAHNPYGVMDHWVELDNGNEIYVPLRVIANEGGTVVQLTLFRQPDMNEATFERDAQWVRRDLARLKALAEQ